MSAIFALLHIAIIIGGPEWYLFFGAGQEMADLAEQGSWVPPLATLGVFAVLLVWALYAFSGAGLIRLLPLLRPALLIIASIYLLRGLVLFPAWIFKPETVDGLLLWSSLVCLMAGGLHAAGIRGMRRDVSSA